MPTLHSDDAELFYEATGSGPEVVLLHPFPLNHTFWTPVSEQLGGQYRVIVPDLRAHGDSDAGNGAATMEKLSADLARLCREEGITKGVFVGVSIGGYLLFEFWRRHREHVTALVLANTRASAETPVSRAARLQSADKVLHEGTSGFIEEMLSRLLAQSTQSNRPDIVDSARRMMQRMSPADIAAIQRGMAERPDSVSTLATIRVPTLIVGGEEDSVPLSELELMQQGIVGSKLHVIPRAGHYAAMEQPLEFSRLLRQFLEGRVLPQ